MGKLCVIIVVVVAATAVVVVAVIVPGGEGDAELLMKICHIFVLDVQCF